MFNSEGFEVLVKDSGLKKQFLAIMIGKKPSIFNDWKAGKSEPKREYLEILAKELGTSPEFLAGESADPFNVLGEQKEKSDLPKETGLSPAKQKLLSIIDELSDEQCEKLFGIIEEAKKLL